jgi:ribosomal protein L7/L12
MERNAQVLAAAIASGKPLETGLEELRRMGVTPVEAIKAIREAQCVSLGDAKQIFSLSPACAAEVRAADLLHDEVLRLHAQGQRQ